MVCRSIGKQQQWLRRYRQNYDRHSRELATAPIVVHKSNAALILPTQDQDEATRLTREHDIPDKVRLRDCVQYSERHGGRRGKVMRRRKDELWYLATGNTRSFRCSPVDKTTMTDILLIGSSYVRYAMSGNRSQFPVRAMPVEAYSN